MKWTYLLRRVLGGVSVAMSITLLNALFRQLPTASLTSTVQTGSPTDAPSVPPTDDPTENNACTGTILTEYNCYNNADPLYCSNYVTYYSGDNVPIGYYQCYSITKNNGEDRCQRYTGSSSPFPNGTCNDYDSNFDASALTPGTYYYSSMGQSNDNQGSESLSPTTRVEIAMYIITIASIGAYLVYLDRFVLIFAALVSSTAGAVSITTYADRTFGGSLSYTHVAAVAYANAGAVSGCLLLGCVHRLNSTERAGDVPVFTPAVVPARSSFTRSRSHRPPVNAPIVY